MPSPAQNNHNSTDPCILHGYAPEAEFARANGVTPRTIRKYRGQPDGLPFVVWGGRVYISIEGGRQFIEFRERRPNRRRRR